MLACSLAHSHIKSNSFICTFIHPGGPGKSWLGRSRAHAEGLLWQGAEGSFGESEGAEPYAKGSPISSSGPWPSSSLFSSVLAREWRLP